MRKLVLFLVGCLALGAICAAQDAGALLARAGQAFRAGSFSVAEKDFRELTKIDPSNLQAQAYLGHSLFRQEKFGQAVAPYERAIELERLGKRLTTAEHRILVDQLVMSYGISGQLKKAHTLLDDAIQKDPDYPLNYYNRACAYAEGGDKAKALENLDLAFQRKANVLKGEEMPDPRADSSFQKYTGDADFKKLMKKIGLS